LATASSYRVILDSNFLLAPFRFKIDIFKELDRVLDLRYKVFVTDGVIQELRSLNSREAKGALSMALKLPVIETKATDVDDALLELASGNTIICTNDKILIEKLKSKGLPVIYVRQKKYLVLDGYLG
jgi:hypothetical protein